LKEEKAKHDERRNAPYLPFSNESDSTPFQPQQYLERPRSLLGEDLDLLGTAKARNETRRRKSASSLHSARKV